MGSVEEIAKPKQEIPQEQFTNGDSANKATLTGVFNSNSKNTPAIIVPEGDPAHGVVRATSRRRAQLSKRISKSVSSTSPQSYFRGALFYLLPCALLRQCCSHDASVHPKTYHRSRDPQTDCRLLIYSIALGLSGGLVVSSALANSYELVVSLLATSWQRGIVAPLNPGYKQEEFEFYIDDMDVALILIPKGAHEQGGPVVAAAKKRGTAIAECYWDGEKISISLKDKGELAAQGRQETAVAQEEDIALILHTSGTTGAPKAVRLEKSLHYSLHLAKGSLDITGASYSP